MTLYKTIILTFNLQRQNQEIMKKNNKNLPMKALQLSAMRALSHTRFT